MTTQAELAAASCGRDLVPGDAGRLHDVAALMCAYGTDLQEAAGALATLATPAWSGAAADSFRTTFAPQPERWRTAADAFAAASQALSTYATALRLAQDDADDALVRYRRGAAAMSHDAATGGRGGMGATMGADDPGARDRALAVIAVDDARGRVRTAGIAAHNAVRAASDGAPEGLSLWQTTAAVLTGLVVDGAELTWNTVLVPVSTGWRPTPTRSARIPPPPPPCSAAGC